MKFMEEKKEEDFDQEFDDEELELTKDAFFSDLMGMEEEIAAEAYELVEHAINLIQTQYYDDSVEILRQAIGLYTQINRAEEIEAINDKISEVYILKERAFRELEVQPEKVDIVEEKQKFSRKAKKKKPLESKKSLEENVSTKYKNLKKQSTLKEKPTENSTNKIRLKRSNLKHAIIYTEILSRKYD